MACRLLNLKQGGVPMTYIFKVCLPSLARAGRGISMKYFKKVCVLLLPILFILGCGLTDSIRDIKEPHLTIVSGDEQQGEILSELPVSLTVKALDEFGVPV